MSWMTIFGALFIFLGFSALSFVLALYWQKR